MDIFKNRNSMIITSVILLLLTGVIFAFNFYSTEQLQEKESTITPTPTSSQRGTSPRNIGSNENTTSGYKELTAKDSGPITFADDSEAASDSIKEQLSDGTIKYTFSSENPNRRDIFLVKNGAIVMARHTVVGSTISDGYKQLLKEQAAVIPGPTFYGSDTLIYFYENEGTALIVNPETETTYEEFTFQPSISLAEFNTKYKSYTK